MFKTIRNTATRTVIGTIAAAGVLAAATAAQAASNLALENASGIDIHYVYISPDYADTWGDDVLGNDILPAGGVFELTSNGDHCIYDVLVVWADGSELDGYGFDFCANDTLVIE